MSMKPCRICGTMEKLSCDGLRWRPITATCKNLEDTIVSKYMFERWTVTGLSKELRVSRFRVKKIITDHRLIRKNARGNVPKASPELVKEILELYSSGKSFRATGALVGITADKCSAIVRHHEPQLMRTSQQQRDISWKTRPRDPCTFFLSDLDLKSARYPCRECGVSLVIPMEAKDSMLLICGLCVGYQYRKQVRP